MEQERHALQGRLMWPCAPQANTDAERAQNWAWCDRKESAQEENDFRGVLAMTLLWEAWEKNEAWPKLIRVHFGEESRLARAALADKPVARRAEGLHVLALEKADKRVSLGSISKEEGLTLAAERSQWAAVIPERVWWFQRATGHFADPCGMLNHVERAYLTQQLERMAKKCASQSQRLYRFAKDVAKEPPILYAMIIEKIRTNGARMAVRMIIIKDICTLETSVVIRVTREDEENLSMFSNEKD